MDSQFFGMLSDMKESIGRIEGKVDNGFESMNNYIGAVNQKATSIRDELQSHKEDNEAHGTKAVRGWINLALAIGGVVIGGLTLWATTLKGENKQHEKLGHGVVFDRISGVERER